MYRRPIKRIVDPEGATIAYVCRYCGCAESSALLLCSDGIAVCARCANVHELARCIMCHNLIPEATEISHNDIGYICRECNVLIKEP